MTNLYAKLAVTNIKNNKQFYLPYLIAGMFSAAMFYCMRAIQGNEGLAQIRGGMDVKLFLTLGIGIIGVFVAIFLFYTNSFLMKRRKKELGLYNILGMEKRHIVKVMFCETVVTFLVSVGGGLAVGILFNKLLTMLLYYLTGLDTSVKFYISWQGCLQTAELFGAIYLVILLYNFMQIKLSNPIALLRSGNIGEKEPKTKVFLAVLGVLCTGAGYYIAITTEDPMAAINRFFIAVLLVMIGTYCLFTAGSIAFLKMLRKNKKYYYQTRHFTTVSGMIYRMKQNAVGLANICILSTMVLVMVSVTVCLYAGIEDEINTVYPAELQIFTNYKELPEREQTEAYKEKVKDQIQKSGRVITDVKEGNAAAITAVREGKKLTYAENAAWSMENVVLVEMMTEQDYESFNGTAVRDLQDGEIAVASASGMEESVLEIGGKEYTVAEIQEFPGNAEYYKNMLGDCIWLIVKDAQTFSEIQKQVEAEMQSASAEHVANWAGGAEGDAGISIEYMLNIDIDGTTEEKIACGEALQEEMNRWDQENPGTSWGVKIRQREYHNYLVLNGGLLYIGLFLGSMFLIITVLIIYYKQITEGYEDKERFAIMEKVGMSNAEVKASIRSQILMVFFLPLVTAVIHLIAAYPLLKRLMAMLGLANSSLFIGCMAGTVLVFGVIYFLVFWMTSRSYYKIVGKQV